MLFLRKTKCCKLDCFTPNKIQYRTSRGKTTVCVVQMEKTPGIASGKIISAPALYRYPHAANKNKKRRTNCNA